MNFNKFDTDTSLQATSNLIENYFEIDDQIIFHFITAGTYTFL